MSRLQKLFALLLFVVIAGPSKASDIDLEKSRLVSAMESDGAQTSDLDLIKAHLGDLSLEQLTAISQFLTNPLEFADSHWFDVSQYKSWDEYNFYRPVGDTILSILARRDLFLDPARQLNNPAITNMSDEALAALAFSQVYVEEKWDHEVPWDGDPNAIFNWIHPDIIKTPNLILFLRNDNFLYTARTEYWWGTYWSALMPLIAPFGISKGTDMQAALRDMNPPVSNIPRLAGYSYPLGNQLFLQTAETVYWYADYVTYGEARYGPFEPKPLDTAILFPESSAEIYQNPSSTDANRAIFSSDPALANNPGLWQLFHAPFGADLREELSQPESAAFWNAMRFVHAGARQREGGGSPEHPENGQPSIIALRYAERTALPVGREQADISAFALLTTVYSDSILLDFTNWDNNTQALIHIPVDTSRSDGMDRQVSERNKAILVVEQMGNENFYPNATHISGSRGLGLHLSTQYDDPMNGDFLPYLPVEAFFLVMALMTESRDYGVESSQITLCNSPLLRQGYEKYVEFAKRDGIEALDWSALTGDLCA